MTYDITTIRANLKTLLETVDGVAVVYDQYELNVSGFPAIMFDISNNESDMLTDTENIRKITFTLYILAEIPLAGRAVAKGLLDSVTKDVVTLLEKKTNMTLSNSADWIMPTVGQREELSIGEGTAFSQRLNLDVMVSSSIL